MSFAPRTPMLLALAAIAGSPLLAQTASVPAGEPANAAPPVAAPLPPPTRAMSAETAAKLSAIAPKYNPPTPPGDQPATDLRDIDKPRNAIIRLPSYIVQEPKMRDFKERELLTPKGRVALVLKRHPGLRFGSLPFLSNLGIGLAMLEEEERLERLAEMTDLLSLFRYGGTPLSDDVKRKAQQSFIRSNEWVDSRWTRRGGPHN